MIDHGLVFDALVLPRHLPALLELAARYPDLAMVLDHGAKPPIASRRSRRLEAGDHRARALDAHGLQALGPGHRSGQRGCRDARGMRSITCSSAFGPKRMMWGSDWPVCELVCSYGEWRSVTDTLLARLSDHRARTDLLRNSTSNLWNLSDWPARPRWSPRRHRESAAPARKASRARVRACSPPTSTRKR